MNTPLLNITTTKQIITVFKKYVKSFYLEIEGNDLKLVSDDITLDCRIDDIAAHYAASCLDLSNDMYKRYTISLSGEEVTTHDINYEHFKYVSSCMPLSDVRYYLNGVAIYSNSALYCTDGHRMHYAGEAVELERPTILRAALVKLINILQPKTKRSNFDINTNKTFTNCFLENATISASNIDGNYPQVSRVIPSKFIFEDNSTLTLDKNTAKSIDTAFKAEGKTGKNAYRHIILEEGQKLSFFEYDLKTKNKQYKTIEFCKVSPFDVSGKIGLDWDYIKAALKMPKGYEFKFLQGDTNVLFSSTCGTLNAVIMPVRI